jgi:hypothetical protein
VPAFKNGRTDGENMIGNVTPMLAFTYKLCRPRYMTWQHQ